MHHKSPGCWGGHAMRPCAAAMHCRRPCNGSARHAPCSPLLTSSRCWRLLTGPPCPPRPLLQSDYGELVDGVQPEWLEVERVIAERQAGVGGGSPSSGGARQQFLCKWRELPYSECTWEDEADIADFRGLVEQFRRRRPIAELDLEAAVAALPPEAPPLGQQAAAQQQEGQQEEWEGQQGEPPASQQGEPPASQQGEPPAGGDARHFAAHPSFLRGQLHPYQVRGGSWPWVVGGAGPRIAASPRHNAPGAPAAAGGSQLAAPGMAGGAQPHPR